MKFTSKQVELLNIAKEKGFVTIETFKCMFSSPISRKANIERFVALGVLTLKGEKYELNKEKLAELENGK